jgi:hypothetical protein
MTNPNQIIEYLVDYARVDVNQRDDSNHTALSWTCYFPDNAKSVEALLRKGADPTIATHDGRTPLMIAAYAGYSDIALLLLRCPSTATATASASDTDLLEMRVGEQNEYHKGCTPLLLAAHGKRWETVRVLLDEGACCVRESIRQAWPWMMRGDAYRMVPGDAVDPLYLLRAYNESSPHTIPISPPPPAPFPPRTKQARTPRRRTGRAARCCSSSRRVGRPNASCTGSRSVRGRVLEGKEGGWGSVVVGMFAPPITRSRAPMYSHHTRMNPNST